MDEAQERFRTLVSTKIYTNFCNAPLRRRTDYLFVSKSFERVTDRDAHWFVRTIESGILSEVDGDFRAERSSALERIFSHGSRFDNPRRLTLAIEAIIGIGAIGRLHSEHKWPRELLGLQPKTWAFDFATYARDSKEPIVVGEVKGKPSEIDKMCDYFEQKIGGDASSFEPGQKNWSRKLKWLQQHDAKVLWALGPNGYERVYRISKDLETGRSSLLPGSGDNLNYGVPGER